MLSQKAASYWARLTLTPRKRDAEQDHFPTRGRMPAAYSSASVGEVFKLRTAGRWVASEVGQSMVELALALPLLAFGLLGGTDMARAYAVQLAVQNGARAAAEGTALDATPTSVEALAHAQQEMNRTPGMTATNATVTVVFAQVNGTTPCAGAANTSIAGLSTIAAPCYVFVRVRYAFSTLIPWPGIPHTFNFDRSTMFRRYQ
jgi:Flp pilus assembly protein TadG